ncbi:MAG: hypothetical protein K6G61_02395 [Solobacterium sp.]|nr:hypothetical protein [Solobacterium sp.]
MEEKDITTKIQETADKYVKILQDSGKSVLSKLDIEKQKAEIRSDIGHIARDLSRIYEKLGRDYYNKKVTGVAIESENDTMDLIRSKEKLIELLNEKLDNLE